MSVRSLALAVLVALAGCSGVPSPGGTQTTTPLTDTVENHNSSGTGPPVKPEALVDISLEWTEPPQGVGSQATLQITVQTKQSITDETLYISVPRGVSLLSGPPEQELTLASGESMTTTVTLEVQKSGTHQIHVYTSNLVAADEGTMRASEVIVIKAGTHTDDSGSEETTPVNRVSF